MIREAIVCSPCRDNVVVESGPKLMQESNENRQAQETPQPDRNVLLDRCRDLAESKSILYLLDQNLKEHGFAGPTDIPQVVFLALLTRVFVRPVSAVIKGPSSSGKSFALHAGLRYVPRTAYEEFQGLSDRALVYSGDLDLRHRHIVLGEAAGLAEGNGRAFLRQLLTEDEIRYRTVQQTKDGHVGRELIIKGPVGLLMTTTANSLHWEDETRLLSLHVDQSPEQIKRALMACVGNAPTKPSPEEDLSRWHALHDYVCSGDLEAKIPYWERVLDQVPYGHPRVLRDIPKVEALIRAHALLHQCSRDRENGKVVATLEDYRVVHDLVGAPLAQGLHENVPPHIREVVDTAMNLWRQTGKRPVSKTEIADALRRDLSVVSRNVNTAAKEGYLEDMNPGQGKKAMLLPGERQPPAGVVLPSPDDLEEKLSANKGGELVPVRAFGRC